ncbi:hypothetical protein [Actinoplanes sp. NPDC020271]|uniref:hypothetical protein n=1 Tax=Actinoplanes sp. NPDC020271 TaxID=3363896 RepID=UPI0037B8DEE9
MAGYFDATANPNYGWSPYEQYPSYTNPDLPSTQFTDPAGQSNSLTFEDVQRKIYNMHPEDMDALADQWDNAVTFLENIKYFVLARSTELQEQWKSPKAAAEFLKRGPGETLAYLDLWIEAAQINRNTLRHAAHISQSARDEMDKLTEEYRSKLHEASQVGFLEGLGAFFTHGNWLPPTPGQAVKEEAHEDIEVVKNDYRTFAQELAHKYGTQYYDTLSYFSQGVGPPIKPMNAVMNNPGMPPMVAPPSLGGAPPPPAAPPAIPPTAPPAAPPANPPAPTQPTFNNPPPGLIEPPGGTPAPVPVAGNQPGLPPGTPGLLPGLPPGLPVVPGQLPLAPGALKPGAQPPALPGAGPKAPSLPPGATSPNPGQLGRGAFNRTPGQPPGLGQPPGRTLRRGGGSPGRTPGLPGRGDRRRDGESSRRPHLPGDGEETFGRPPGSTMPPVLKNPAGNRDRRRPGSTEELRPDTTAGSGDAFRPDGAAPPVLNRPSTPATPPPARRRDETDRERRTTAWADYFGTEAARSESGTGMLSAPGVPPTGSRVSGLEEIPRGLRSHAANRAHEAAQRGPRDAEAPELAKRRTISNPAPAQQLVDDESTIVTDEQAFEVQTPGGGVVTSKRDEPVYEPEIRRVLGGGQ